MLLIYCIDASMYPTSPVETITTSANTADHTHSSTFTSSSFTPTTYNPADASTNTTNVPASTPNIRAIVIVPTVVFVLISVIVSLLIAFIVIKRKQPTLHITVSLHPEPTE